MKRKKKAPPPKPPRVEQIRGGVRVVYPGRAIRRPGPDRSVVRQLPPPIRCPYCREEGRGGRCSRSGGGSTPGSSIYECLECCDPEQGRPTRFLVFSVGGDKFTRLGG